MNKEMQNITMENFEAFCLDYFEGNLDKEQANSLMSFLEIHPEAKQIFDEFADFSLEPDTNIVFENKHDLLKESGNINIDNIDEFLVLSMDQELDSKLESELNGFLDDNPSFKESAKSFQETKLLPDLDIKFENKEQLKKKAVIPLFNRKVILATLSAAAMLAFALIVQNPFNDRQIDRVNDLTYASHVSVNELEISQDLIPIPTRKNVAAYSAYVSNFNEEINVSRVNPIAELSFAYNSITLETDVSTKVEHITKRLDLIHKHEFAVLKQKLEAREEIEKYNEKSLLGKVTYTLAKRLTGKRPAEMGIPENISLWSLADFGVDQFAHMTNSDMDIHRTKKEDERIITFSYNSKKLNIERRRRQSE